jgi:hypothetical protein
MSEPHGDDLLQGTAEVGMDSPHPTVSPSVSLVMRDGLALPTITSRGQWLGQRYVLMMQCLSANHDLYVYPWIKVVNAPRGSHWSAMALRSPEELSVYRSGEGPLLPKSVPGEPTMLHMR